MTVTKSNETVNRLNRTKKELYPDLASERQAYDRTISIQRKADLQAQKKAEKSAKLEAQQQEELRSYKHLMQVCQNTVFASELAMHVPYQGIVCVFCPAAFDKRIGWLAVYTIQMTAHCSIMQ